MIFENLVLSSQHLAISQSWVGYGNLGPSPSASLRVSAFRPQTGTGVQVAELVEDDDLKLGEWCAVALGICDPLPTEQRKRKNKAEIGLDLTVEKHKKRLRPFGRQSSRIGV